MVPAVEAALGHAGHFLSLQSVALDFQFAQTRNCPGYTTFLGCAGSLRWSDVGSHGGGSATPEPNSPSLARYYRCGFLVISRTSGAKAREFSALVGTAKAVP